MIDGRDIHLDAGRAGHARHAPGKPGTRRANVPSQSPPENNINIVCLSYQVREALMCPKWMVSMCFRLAALQFDWVTIQQFCCFFF